MSAENFEFASYYDLPEVTKEVIDETLEACSLICYDAVNLQFELSSSTSGMYAKWVVRISPSCTVYLNKLGPRGLPQGRGSSLNKALLDLAKNCKETHERYEKERNESKTQSI